MSLLRAGRNALPRQTAARSSAISLATRGVASESKTAAVASKEDHDIAAPLPKDVMTAEVISGAPEQLRHRAVRIFQPARNTMQSGTAKTDRWRIDFDILQGGGRWENPLMGWASSADYMQGTRITFKSKEDAVHFAEKQGRQPPVVKRVPPKNYAENYLYKPNKLRIARTK
ncbi:hypothetical protein PLICRDRAFT_55666 [Plicaturopsis crispa FD-325 SS-3]|nr:hypothetical protein PLICRDRAFT_55666 [Plicaturopsis crispa FD-325 SS-3]